MPTTTKPSHLPDETWFCRVCGLLQLYQPWGADGRSPEFTICDCCGTEFGYEDGLLSGVLRARERWLNAGAPWWQPKKRPSDWDLEAQLAQIPPRWRG